MKHHHLTLLCGFSALVVSQVIYALPAEAYKAGGRFEERASAPAGYKASAYFGPEEDEAEDQAEDEAEAEAEEEAEKQAEEEAEDQAEDEAEAEAEEEAEKQAEEEAEKQAEEEAEKQAEEEAEKQAEEEAEKQAEEEAEKQAEEEAEKQAEEEAEKQAEEEAEKQAEEEAEKQAEEEAEKQAEEEAEKQAEEEAEKQAEEEAEKQAEEEAEKQAEEEAEKQAEEEAEKQAEEEAEKQAEEEAEKQAEEEAEKQAEEEAEKQAEEEAEKQAEEEAEKQAEDEAEKQAEEEAEDLADEMEDAAEDAAKEAEDAAEEAAKEAEDAAEEAAKEAEDAAEDMADNIGAVTGKDEGDVRADDDGTTEHLDGLGEPEDPAPSNERSDDRDDKSQDDRQESLGDDTFRVAEQLVAERDYFEVEEEFGAAFVTDEVLLLAERDAAEAIDLSSFEERNMEYLPGLDMVLVRARRTEPAELQGDIDALSAALESGAVDRNHLYAPENAVGHDGDSKSLPANMARSLGFEAHAVPGLAIGLIDTAIETKHPLFAPGTIIAQDFVSYDAPRPMEHGTAVASILVGQRLKDSFGLLPGATLYSASVFLETSKGEKVATAESLVRALDWMLQSKVKVVNMSLSGPQNALLEIAVRRSIDRGMTIVAAVGNAGPGAAPLYPAAIDPVVAVTAVDYEGRVFLRANRGMHVDLSAPGVSVFTGNASGGVGAKTGTSIASPFVAAMLAQLAMEKYGGEVATAFEAIKAQATDLGKPGFDETYGYGLARTNSE